MTRTEQAKHELKLLEGKEWLLNKEIKKLVEQRQQVQSDIAKLKKQLNINPQSEFIL